MRGATECDHADCTEDRISIHAPHARSDHGRKWRRARKSGNFNPRSSCEERRSGRHCLYIIVKYFNPRSSCEERHLSKSFNSSTTNAFQSTLLMRGATASATSMAIGPSNFNPRSSCEERRKRARRLRGGLGFQSTLLMRGATSSSERGGEARVRDFNPRSSCEERPAFSRTAAGGKNISIHAPHARSDFRFSSVSTQLRDFNPRSSCEERRAYLSIGLSGLQTFQSTLLMRGATRPVTMASFAVVVFQSTLLMRGATDFDRASSSYVVFQSTLLMRGATEELMMVYDASLISIHAPHARSDFKNSSVTA